MSESEVISRLAEMGLSLPEPPVPVAAYVPVAVSRGLAFVAGQVPMRDGALLHPGILGEGVSVEQGQEGTRHAALLSLAALRAELGSLDRVSRIVQVSVFVASTAGFHDQSKVANGASELLVSVMGDIGKHARAAVGVPALPLGSSVEVAMIAEVD
jgi:enamine deaminase RidA (YjgF/YER057c/UK114 family)